jgi:hypothetical protein
VDGLATVGARLVRILAQLADPEDRAWLVDQLTPKSRRRSRRLDERDRLIRSFAVHFPYISTGRAMAPAIAGAIDHYATTGWRFEQGKPATGDAKRRLAHRILSLNNGKSLSAGQIRTILAGLR